MTRDAWTAIVASRQDRMGGDLWNTDQVYRQAFQDLGIAAVTHVRRTTGLWADATVRLTDGRTIVRRFYA